MFVCLCVQMPVHVRARVRVNVRMRVYIYIIIYIYIYMCVCVCVCLCVCVCVSVCACVTIYSLLTRMHATRWKAAYSPLLMNVKLVVTYSLFIIRKGIRNGMYMSFLIPYLRMNRE